MRRFASLFLAAGILLPTASSSAQTCNMNVSAGGATNHWANAGTSGSTDGCPLLNTGLGGPADFGTGVLTANDDNSSAAISLDPAFPSGLNFYGGPYHTMYVNNNGNVTFNGILGTYTPSAFPLPAPTGGTMPAPMIAAYWSDIDTRASTTANHNRVYWDLRPGQVTVTWYDVGYFASKYNHRMSFQMIIRNGSGCGEGDFDVEFRYNVCGFTTGDVSGGTDGHGGTCAQVGFDADDGTHFVTLMESLMPAIENVCINSNNTPATPGIYNFGVRGGRVQCTGGGSTCTVPGAMGACAIGVNACQATGVQCQSVGTASPETCDNIDNDCNGSVDDGSGLCPAGEICVLGSCIAPCFEGTCATGFTCGSDGQCVEDDCVGVSCPANQRCIHGSCMDSCTGVVCPHNQQCAAGRCTDLCAVLTCDSGYVCQDGMCVGQCPCNPCPDGDVCNSDGTCSPSGCDIVTCDPGQYCQGGTCMDSCAGAMCPANQHCTLGECVLDGIDAGMTSDIDAAVIHFTDTGTHGSMDAGVSGNADAGHGPRRTTGCGCRVGSASQSGSGYLLLLVLGVVIARRRRGAA